MSREVHLERIKRLTNPAYIPVWRIVGRKDVSFRFLKRNNKIIVYIEAKTKDEAMEIFEQRYGDHFDEYQIRRATPKKNRVYAPSREVEVEHMLGDEFEVRDME